VCDKNGLCSKKTEVLKFNNLIIKSKKNKHHTNEHKGVKLAAGWGGKFLTRFKYFAIVKVNSFAIFYYLCPINFTQ